MTMDSCLDRFPLSSAGTLAVLLALGSLYLTGCQSPLGGISAENDSLTEKLTSIEDIHGPLQRVLHSDRGQKSNSLQPAAGQAEYDRAKQLYDQQQYAAAEDAFEEIADDYPDSPVREDALFMVAESQFQRKRYSWAQDSYALLLKEYPATRHLEQSTERLFTIARNWLQSPKMASAGDVQQASLETPGSMPTDPSEPANNDDSSMSWPDPSRVIPVFPNFFDRSRPLFDTEGRALQALRSIWLNDPTGPLADDALMLSATHHFRDGDYLEADRLFSIIREEYPKSPHLKNAFVLGSHVKLLAYQGPAYDGTKLEEARQLKESALRLFSKEIDTKRLHHELQKIERSKARRDWEMAQYYRRQDKPKGVAIYCRLLIDSYPGSPYARKARNLLRQLGPEAFEGLPGEYGQPARPKAGKTE